jgi:cellulose synthase/poly-beta-1,6-N-acetylglucosamine synthase-like glycosyltransferase
VAVFAQWTTSQRLWNVLVDLPGRVGLLGNPSHTPYARAVNGSVTGIVGLGGTGPELFAYVEDRPESSVPHPTVTVVICAHSEDRWDDLVPIVASVKQQTYRPAEIVLVIDHNPILQRRSASELVGVKVVPNDNEKGLPGARNAGVAAAESEIVAFVDDAVVERNWLAALAAPYADPRVLGVGGQVIPVWQTGRPNWFPPEFDWVVGCSYRSMPTERTQVRNFNGAIMSMRRRILVESGGFDTGLSRIGNRSLGCEEREICARLQRRHLGGVYLYEPKALVWRHVPPSRTTWSYFRSRCYADGLSKAVVRGLAGPEWTTSSEKPYLRSIIPRAIGRNLGRAVRGQPSGIAGMTALTGGVLINGIGYTVGRIRLPSNTTSTQVRWPTMTELGAIG